jgi:hypothetical protein
MFKSIYTVTIALTLFLTQAAHALPQWEQPQTESTVTVTFDNTYDDPNLSLNSVACSNGQNGLVGRFATLGDIPGFPLVGGAPGVTWNSAQCGSCWALANPQTNETIYITAVDYAGDFNIAEGAFVRLNNYQVGLGYLTGVEATQVATSKCGL